MSKYKERDEDAMMRVFILSLGQESYGWLKQALLQSEECTIRQSFN